MGTDTDTETDFDSENENENVTDSETENVTRRVRLAITAMVRVFLLFEHLMAVKDYASLQRFFENVILMESRPILRWLLFVVDRSGCFGSRALVLGKDMGDVTVFCKALEQYLRAIHAVLNAEKVKEQHSGDARRARLL